MTIDELFQSKLFRGIILAIMGIIIFVFIFGLGVFVGTKRADFSFRWAEEYHKNFGGPQNGFFGNMMGNEFTDANGVFGQVIKIEGQILTIKGRDNVEKNILVTDETTIVYQKKNIKLSEVKIDESVIVIGDPDNNGQIQAELIRVLPMPPKNLPIGNLPASLN